MDRLHNIYVVIMVTTLRLIEVYAIGFTQSSLINLAEFKGTVNNEKYMASLDL